MSLSQPSRTIVVEPVEAAAERPPQVQPPAEPSPAPAAPREETPATS